MNRLAKNKENFIWFSVAFAVILLVYGAYFRDSFIMDHIASEDYWTVAPPPATWAYYFAQGRATGWFWNLLFYKLGVIFDVTKLKNSWPITLTEMLVLSSAMVSLHAEVRKFFNTKYQELLSFVLIMLCIVNPLYEEYFVYYALEIAVALLMTVLAVKSFNRGHYVVSGIWLLLAVWTYQNFFELYFVWVSLFILLKCDLKPTINEFVEFIKACGAAVVAIGVNLLCTKLAMWATYGKESAKVMVDNVAMAVTGKVASFIPALAIVGEYKKLWTGENPLFDALWSVRNGIGVMVKNMVMPTRLMLILSFVCCVGIIATLIKKKTAWGSVILAGFWLVFINCCYLIIYLSGMGDYSGRVSWIFFAGISATFLLCLFAIRDNRVALNFFSGIFTTSFVAVCAFTISYSSDFYKKCDMDRTNINYIISAIEDYEKGTGKEITKISVCASPNMEYASHLLKMDYSLGAYSYNCKSYNRNWSDVSMINVFTGKKYERLDMTEEEFNERFSDYESWTDFDINSQLRFEGDTLYWAKF
ncbi:MAG: glucosyltransferase domain-containing protein [Pseudobutyrivibrio sp.]|nr:glucosyltransferase domain-containing protein [Pseudobutyrivibrio sp.]MCF0185983.1 glucosyltransferase domain-containing protein [Bacteroidaceae bacterium]